MLRVGRVLFSAAAVVSKDFSVTSQVSSQQCRGLKACVLGAMSGIGEPLSLMVKQSPWFEEAALFDIVSCKGIAMELNHIDTPCLVTAYEGEEGLKQALKGCNFVLNAAGELQKGTTTKEQLLEQNASIAYKLARQCAQHCPQAFHLVLSNPINSILPMIVEVYKNTIGSVDPSKIFGVTSIDALRASAFVADITRTPPETVKVPVIGGHSLTTIVPLLSKTEPCVSLTTEETLRITRAVQTAEDDVVNAKEGEGPPTLSVAYSAIRLAESIVRAMFGEQGIVECGYVMSNLIPDVKYFASPVMLGPTGIQKILPLPELSNYEGCILQTAIESLKKDIEKGENYYKG